MNEEIKQILISGNFILKTPYCEYYFCKINKQYCSSWEDINDEVIHYNYEEDINELVDDIMADCCGDFCKILYRKIHD